MQGSSEREAIYWLATTGMLESDSLFHKTNSSSSSGGSSASDTISGLLLNRQVEDELSSLEHDGRLSRVSPWLWASIEPR